MSGTDNADDQPTFEALDPTYVDREFQAPKDPLFQRRWFRRLGGAVALIAAAGAIVGLVIVVSGEDEEPDGDRVTIQEAAAANEDEDADGSEGDDSDDAEGEEAAEPTTPAPTATPDATPFPTVDPESELFRSVAEAGITLNKLEMVDRYQAARPFDELTYRSTGWGDLDGDCRSTRTEVLAAESIDPVEWSFDECEVIAGRWMDVWSGQEITEPTSAVIVPVVDLEHAHEAGAWRWDADTRRRFVNDAHPQALHVVSTATSSFRASGGPSTWQPGAEAARCAYAIDWVTTKERWGLTITDVDFEATGELFAGCLLPTSDGPRDEEPIDPAVLTDRPVVTFSE